MYKEFNNFKIVGDSTNPLFRIYGLDENNKEELIYEIKFNNRDLMLHVYFSIFSLLNSRIKVRNLLEFLNKATIPVVMPNIWEYTPNILKKAKQEFQKWLSKEKIKDKMIRDADIIKIDNDIKEIDANIDALVFKLYGLAKDEVKVVLDSLKTPISYQQKIFSYFKIQD